MNRVGEVWRGSFNGYLITGIVTKSAIATRIYHYEPYDIWVHWVKISDSDYRSDIGKTHKWKEYSHRPWHKNHVMKLISHSNAKWNITDM